MSDPITTPATGPGAVTHLIQVQYDPSTLSLDVSRSSVSINPGDTVVWNFLGIPAGWTPWIEFRKVGDSSFVGPLDGLSQTAGGIWGVCRSTGWTGDEPVQFEYRAMMQRGFADGWDTQGSLVWSTPVKLSVRPATAGQERTFSVAVVDGVLDIQPPGRVLEPGDTIVWQFQNPGGMDANAWRPRIKFNRYEGTGTVSNLQLGPFSALTVMPGELRGTGNNNANGVYFFEVALVSVATGEIGWVSSGDPAVDNRGGVSTVDDP